MEELDQERDEVTLTGDEQYQAKKRHACFDVRTKTPSDSYQSNQGLRQYKYI